MLGIVLAPSMKHTHQPCEPPADLPKRILEAPLGLSRRCSGTFHDCFPSGASVALQDNGIKPHLTLDRIPCWPKKARKRLVLFCFVSLICYAFDCALSFFSRPSPPIHSAPVSLFHICARDSRCYYLITQLTPLTRPFPAISDPQPTSPVPTASRLFCSVAPWWEVLGKAAHMPAEGRNHY